MPRQIGVHALRFKTFDVWPRYGRSGGNRPHTP